MSKKILTSLVKLDMIVSKGGEKSEIYSETSENIPRNNANRNGSTIGSTP